MIFANSFRPISSMFLSSSQKFGVRDHSIYPMKRGGEGAEKRSAEKVEKREKPHKEWHIKKKKAVKESVGQKQIIVGKCNI